MRKILSTVLLMMTVLCGKSQIILNEIYTEPALGVPVKKGPKVDHHEFFELYNNNVNTTINLNCYTLVTFTHDKNGNKRIIYVLDLPDVNILPKSYFVGASTSPFNVQGDELLNLGLTANFVWSNQPSGTLTKYEVSNNNLITSTTQITGQLSDLFPVLTPSDLQTAVFLFNNGVYQSGFMVGLSSTVVPDLVKTLPSVPGSCESTINFSTINSAEYVGSSAGTDNGFARITDGQCAGWFKTASGISHTPKRTNGHLNTSGTTGTLTTTQGYPCGTHVVFNVTGPTTSDLIPVNVHIYRDNAIEGTLDPSTDTYLTTIPVNSFTEGPHIYQIPDAFKNLPLLIVYETKYGCYDKIVALSPQSSGSITTEEKNICESRVDFRITGATTGSNANTYALPVNVYLYYDKGIIGTYEPNVDIDLVPQVAPLSNPRLVDKFSQDLYTFNIPTEAVGQPVIMVYDATYGCFDKNVVPAKAFGRLTTTETNICGETINVSISVLESAVYAFPITAKLYYGDDPSLIDFKEIQPGSPSIAFTNLDPSKTAKIVYEYTYSCFENTVTRNNTVANLQVGGEVLPDMLNGTRTVNYFLQSLGTATEAFPLDLEAWEDINKNGVLDSASTDGTSPSIDKLIGSQRIESITATNAFEKFVAQLTNPSSHLIVKATSTPTCAYNKVFIINNYIPLPVHFQSFNAARNKDKKEQVVLKWVTATEQNNRGFNVQRKVGGQWKNIAFIFSQADDGNSSTPLVYEYKDMNVSNTVTQYQIQQVDYDRKTSYSDIKAVPGMEQKKTVLTYPNPGVDGKINLLFSEIGGVKEVIVSDMNGRIVKQYRQVTENNLTIDGLQSGFYTVKITDRTTAITTVEKVIIR